MIKLHKSGHAGGKYRPFGQQPLGVNSFSKEELYHKTNKREQVNDPYRSDSVGPIAQNLIDKWNEKCGRFARPSLRTGHHITTLHQSRNRVLLKCIAVKLYAKTDSTAFLKIP